MTVSVPGSVAVIANFYAGLLGGPLSQLLKCLAAVKVCAEFEKSGVTAVPVCWVRQDAPPGFSPWEISFVDRHSKLHHLKSTAREDGTSVISGDEIEKIFPDGDRDTLSALKDAFAPDTNLVSSCARWLKYLLKDFGAIVMEDGAPAPNQNELQCSRQSRIPPAAAFVADSAEIAEYVNTPPLKASEGVPLIWPSPDVTVSNAGSLKTLRRYGLDFARLLDGKARVMDYVRETLKSDVPLRLQKLRDETGEILNELGTAIFAARGDHSGRIRASRAARIIYQFDKIQRHSRTALHDKEKAAENRICKACDFLAPRGRRQKDVLGGAQIPVFYGSSGLRALYERLDITTTNHQLIGMD